MKNKKHILYFINSFNKNKIQNEKVKIYKLIYIRYKITVIKILRKIFNFIEYKIKE